MLPGLALKKKITCLFISYVCEVYTIACMWKSEDTFEEPALSPFRQVTPTVGTQSH